MKNSSVEKDLAQRAEQANILRGIFVHKLGEQQADEQAAVDFWRESGFEVELLETGLSRHDVRPDFRLDREGRPWAYCEVKTLWRHTWTTTILHENQPPERQTGFTEKTAEERLSGDLLLALRVLHRTNSDHALPNIILLVNHDPELSPASVARVLAVPPASADANLKSLRDTWMAEELNTFRSEIDLCIWADGLENGRFAVRGYFPTNPELQNRIKQVADQVCERQISLEPAA